VGLVLYLPSACRLVGHPVVTARTARRKRGPGADQERNGKDNNNACGKKRVRAARRRSSYQCDAVTGRDRIALLSRPRSDEKCRCLLQLAMRILLEGGMVEGRQEGRHRSRMSGCPVCRTPRPKGLFPPREPRDPDSRDDGSSVAAIGSADHIQNTDAVWACRVWLSTINLNLHCDLAAARP
jgi:hypothetical protein